MTQLEAGKALRTLTLLAQRSAARILVDDPTQAEDVAQRIVRRLLERRSLAEILELGAAYFEAAGRREAIATLRDERRRSVLLAGAAAAVAAPPPAVPIKPSRSANSSKRSGSGWRGTCRRGPPKSLTWPGSNGGRRSGSRTGWAWPSSEWSGIGSWPGSGSPLDFRSWFPGAGPAAVNAAPNSMAGEVGPRRGRARQADPR